MTNETINEPQTNNEPKEPSENSAPEQVGGADDADYVFDAVDGVDAELAKNFDAGFAKYAKDGIKAYLQDKRRETQEAVNKDLNLLGLRRWHYDHPKDYQEFINLFSKAYDGDMSFFIKGMSYLTEMLSLDGIEGITELLESLCLGTESYNKAQFSNNNQQVHERLKDLFASTLNQETVKQKFLHNNPFMCSADKDRL